MPDMKFQAWVTYPKGNQREVKNLRWLREHSAQICELAVMRFEPIETAEAFLSADLTDGTNYTTGFCSASVLRKWLDNPKFRGKRCNWFGKDEIITRHW